MPEHFDIAHVSDRGRSYHINCDQTIAIGREGLEDAADAFVLVADGMGASIKGETASRLVAEKLPEIFLRELKKAEKPVTDDALLAALRTAAQETNELVWRTAQENPDLKGMGSTCIAAVIRGSTVLACHAGDSRAYLLSGDELLQLTADHSMIQEVVGAPDPSIELEARFGTVITRGIGLGRMLDADVVRATLAPKDALLLCTDGLSNMISDDTIAATLAEAPDASTACQKLVEKANEAGGLDNIGVVVVRGPEFQPYTIAREKDSRSKVPSANVTKPPSRRQLQRANAWLVALVVLQLIVNLALGAFAWWAHSEKQRLSKENATIKKQFLDYVEQAERRGRMRGPQ